MAINLKRNDTRPFIEYAIPNRNGGPVDLTGCSVFFIMAKYRNREVVINREATIKSPSQGIVLFSFAPEETNVVGIMVAEFIVTFQDDTVETFPNSSYLLINIEKGLSDSAPVPIQIINAGTFLNPDDATVYDGGDF